LQRIDAVAFACFLTLFATRCELPADCRAIAVIAAMVIVVEPATAVEKRQWVQLIAVLRRCQMGGQLFGFRPEARFSLCVGFAGKDGKCFATSSAAIAFVGNVGWHHG